MGYDMKRFALKSGLVSFLIIASTTNAYAKSLKFSTPTPPSHIFTKAALHFGRDLEAESQGRLKLRVHPLNKLGNVATVISLLQSGAINFAIVPAGDLARREMSFYGWFLPYTFTDITVAGKAATTEPAKKMLRRLEKQDLIGLGYVFPGQRHVISTSPINTLNDLKNKKVRTFPNEIFKMWWDEVGAAPIGLPLPQVAPSLATGVLDAVDIDLDIVVGLKLNTYAPYLGLTNHMSFPGVVLASKKWFDFLPANDKRLIRDNILDMQDWAIQTQVKSEISNLEKLQADGMTIKQLDGVASRAIGTRIRESFLNRDELIKSFYKEVNNSQLDVDIKTHEDSSNIGF